MGEWGDARRGERKEGQRKRRKKEGKWYLGGRMNPGKGRVLAEKGRHGSVLKGVKGWKEYG